jgi:molecular chaperone GrpE
MSGGSGPDDPSTDERADPTPDPPQKPSASPPAKEEPPAEDWQVRYRYLLAEFDNYRKRTERERDAIRRETKAQLLRQFLPLHDALDRAEEFLKELPAQDPLRTGLDLFAREWRRVLTSEEISEVGRVGETFRPDEEEAVGEVEATGEHPDGSVAEVVQRGYQSPAGLLRPAKVVVARAKEGKHGHTKPKGDADVLASDGDPAE